MTSNRPYLLRAMHEWICDNGLTPYIVVDAGKPGVQVPPQAIRDGKVVLNLVPRAVARLEIGNEVITFMARFGGASHAVSVPVAAVQAIYARENGQGMLLADEGSGATAAAGPRAPKTAGSVTPSLQSVPTPSQDRTVSGNDAESSADGDKPDKSGKSRPKGKPSLHVVK